MDTSLLFWIVLAIYVAAGIFVTKFVKNSTDFYVMGEKAGTILVVGTLSATYLSAVTLLGIAGICYTEGPLVLPALGSFGAWMGTMIAVLYIGRRFKALECRTMPDFFMRRFRSKWVTGIAVVIMVIGLLGYGVIQLMGAGLVLSEITGLSYNLIIVGFTIALLVFCAGGGMWGVVVTDTLMFFTMLVIACVISPMLIAKGGGLSHMVSHTAANIGKDFWTLGGMNHRHMSWTFSQFLVWVLFFGCSPALVSRVFPAKNDFVLMKSAVIGVFMAPFLQIMTYLGAVAVAVILPGITPADRCMIVAFNEIVPSGWGAIGLAGLMASIMSTASTLFVLAGFGLARDLYENLVNPELDEKTKMRIGRICQVALAAVVCLIAISRPPAIYWISIYAGALFAVGWFASVVGGLEWRRITKEASLISMLSGVGSFVIIKELVNAQILTLPGFIDPLMIAILLSIAGLLVGAVISKPTPECLAYFRKVKDARLSRAILDEAGKSPEMLAYYRKEYKQTFRIAVAFIVISVVLWGYIGIRMALPLM